MNFVLINNTGKKIMSEVMLHGILNMPPELWSGSPIDVMQRHSRYVQASEYIDELTEERDKLANILKQCLHAMPCSYVPNHTIANLPSMIADQAQMLGEECNRADALEEQIEKLQQQIADGKNQWKLSSVCRELTQQRDEAREQQDMLKELLVKGHGGVK